MGPAQQGIGMAPRGASKGDGSVGCTATPTAADGPHGAVRGRWRRPLDVPQVRTVALEPGMPELPRVWGAEVD
eukprot:9854373-Alexandrium_andersonii.AAC.1